jgi:hypothetical protein
MKPLVIFNWPYDGCLAVERGTSKEPKKILRVIEQHCVDSFPEDFSKVKSFDESDDGCWYLDVDSLSRRQFSSLYKFVESQGWEAGDA